MYADFGAINQIIHIWLIHWINWQYPLRFCDKFEVMDFLGGHRLRYLSTGPMWSQGDSFIQYSTVGRGDPSFWPQLWINAVNRSVFFSVSSQVQCSGTFGTVLSCGYMISFCTCNYRVLCFAECCFVSIWNGDFFIMLKRVYKRFLVRFCI